MYYKVYFFYFFMLQLRNYIDLQRWILFKDIKHNFPKYLLYKEDVAFIELRTSALEGYHKIL